MPWSSSGKRLGNRDPRIACHKAYTCHRRHRKESVRIFENVPQYPTSQLEEDFGDEASIFPAILDPRDLGFGASRSRLWAIIIDNEKASWDCDLSYEQLLQVLAAAPVMTAKDLRVSSERLFELSATVNSEHNYVSVRRGRLNLLAGDAPCAWSSCVG